MCQFYTRTLTDTPTTMPLEVDKNYVVNAVSVMK